MKKPSIILTVLAIIALSLAACSGSDDTADEPSAAESMALESPEGVTPAFEAPPVGGMTTFMDTNNGYEIDHPKNWKMQMEGEDGCPTTMCFAAPAQEGQVPAAIMVTVGQTEAENLQTAWNTVRQLFIGSAGVQPKTVPGTQGNTELAGETAKTSEYTLDWGLIPSQMRQTLTLNSDGIPFMVTTISAESIWNDVDPTFVESTTSFTLG